MNTADFIVKDSSNVTIEGIERASNALEKFMSDNDLIDPPSAIELEKDGYVYCTTADDKIFLMEKKHAIKAYIEKNEVLYFPSCFADTPSVLEKTFEVARVEGEGFYEVNSSLIVKPHSCRNFYLKDNVYLCSYSNKYYINRDDMIADVEEYPLVHKSVTIMTVDTNELKITDRCYAYRKPDGSVDYYRYGQLAPDYRFNGNPFWFDETKPKALKGRGVGIELEINNAGKTCLEVLKNKNFRDYWSTVRDGSIPGSAAEFVSVPLELCEIGKVGELIRLAKEHGAREHSTCGYHVHISGSDLNYMDLSSLINLALGVQSEIFMYVHESRINNQFCRLLDGTFLGFSRIKSKKDRIKAGSTLYGDEGHFKERHKQSKYSGGNSRHYWLNIDRMFRFRNRKERDKRTVEFRLYQADFNDKYFERMILLFYYMVEYAKNHSQKTCMSARLRDVVNFAPYHHRRELQLLIK